MSDFKDPYLERYFCLCWCKLCQNCNNFFVPESENINAHYLLIFKSTWAFVISSSNKLRFVFRPLTFGEIGCFLSHWYIWQEVNIFHDLPYIQTSELWSYSHRRNCLETVETPWIPSDYFFTCKKFKFETKFLEIELISTISAI